MAPDRHSLLAWTAGMRESSRGANIQTWRGVTENQAMRINGANYDPGTYMGINRRPVFNPQAVRLGLQVIEEDVHRNAIGITALDTRQLVIVATPTLEQGLDVWASTMRQAWRGAFVDTFVSQIRDYVPFQPVRKKERNFAGDDLEERSWRDACSA